MNIKDCKIGQIIVGNEESVGRYSYTAKDQGFVGEIVGVNTSSIDVKTLACKSLGRMGGSFNVDPVYFELKTVGMSIEDCKVGQIIVGNDVASPYAHTCKKQNFVGEIVEICDKKIKVKILKCSRGHEVGNSYTVSPRYFDLKTTITKEEGEVKKMNIVRVSDVEKVDFDSVVYGDILELENGDLLLIGADDDGTDYRGFNLTTSKATEFHGNIRRLIEGSLNTKAVKHIPASKVTLNIVG